MMHSTPQPCLQAFQHTVRPLTDNNSGGHDENQLGKMHNCYIVKLMFSLAQRSQKFDCALQINLSQFQFLLGDCNVEHIPVTV